MTPPHPNEPGDSEQERTRALIHLAKVSALLLAVLAVDYVLPGLRRFRPWQSGDEALLGFLFRDPDEEAVGPAVPPRVARRPPSAPVETVDLDPAEWGRVDVPIIDPEFRGLDRFFTSLKQTALAKPGALTRVGHYGDSSIATDLITSTMRRNLQGRFGDGGHGFVLVAKGYLPYRHLDVEHRGTSAWELREITRRHLSAGTYGYGGVQFRPLPGARATFGTSDRGPVGSAVDRFLIYYESTPSGGVVEFRLDDGDWQSFSTEDGTTRPAVHTIDVQHGQHEMDLRPAGRGQVRLFGVALETAGPGIVYDSLGLVGARANRLLNYDQAHIAAALEQRQVDLLILGFGGNDADDDVESARYQAEYLEVIERMRGDSDMSCLVFAPLDQGMQNEQGRVVTMPTIPIIVAAQRAAALEAGCAFYDTWNAMGGQGAVARGLRSSPRIASGDLRHMTPAGYEMIGDHFYRALLQSFGQWLDANDARAVAPPVRALAQDAATPTPLDAGVNVDGLLSTDASVEDVGAPQARRGRGRRARRTRRARSHDTSEADAPTP